METLIAGCRLSVMLLLRYFISSQRILMNLFYESLTKILVLRSPHIKDDCHISKFKTVHISWGLEVVLFSIYMFQYFHHQKTYPVNEYLASPQNNIQKPF